MGAEESPAMDIKVLLEMAIHELCIAQDKITDIHHEIQHEIHPRIIHALSSLDEVMALKAIDMDEDIHQSFLETCQKARQLQEVICCPTIAFQQPTIQEKGKAVDTSETSETEEDDFTVIVPKVYKPLQEPQIKRALTMEEHRSYTHWVYTAQNTNSQIIDTSGVFPRIHFLAGSNEADVTQAVNHGYCGSITSSP